MKKAIKVSKKALSVTLALLMVFTSWVWFAPEKAEAADSYYVRVYLNIYDGADSDDYGEYTVVNDKSSEFYGKPDNYKWDYGSSWSATDNSKGYDGHINMAGFTLFYGDTYQTEDLSDELIMFQNENGTDKYVDFDPNDTTVTVDYLNNLKSSKEGGIYEPYVYAYTLTEFPTSLFWLNDVESPWTNIGDNDASFAITKITVASNSSSDEHILWQGYSGAESKAYCYYGEISANGIRTCYDDTQENMATHYLKYTTSPVGSWYNPLAAGTASVYPVNNYISGGVSASFTEKDPGTVTNIDFINVGDGNEYRINFTNHSTQGATITLFKSENKALLDGYYDNFHVPSGETVSFKLNKSLMNGDQNGDPGYYDFSFKFKLDNVYNSDGTTQTDFYQAAGIGTWNTVDDSKAIGKPSGESSNNGFTLYRYGTYNLDISNQFMTDLGIIEEVSTSGNRTTAVTFNYKYWIDTSGLSDWSQTGLRMYSTRYTNYRHVLQEKDTDGTISIANDYDVIVNNASIGMAGLVGTYNGVGDVISEMPTGYATTTDFYRPYWAETNANRDKGGYLYDYNSGYFRFTGNIFKYKDSADTPARIVFDGMTWRNYNDNAGTFSGDINVYAFDKTDLRNYVRSLGGLGSNWAPMRDRFSNAQWNAYENALKTAKEVLADQKTTQKAVTDAYNALYSATEALKEVTSLKSQVAEVTYTQRESDYDSAVVSGKELSKYLIIPVNTDTSIPSYDSYKYTTNGNVVAKQSNITVNYNQYETGIQPVDYRYWKIDFTGVEEALTKAGTLLYARPETYSEAYYETLKDARDALSAFDRDADTWTPTHQADINNALTALNELLAHDSTDASAHDFYDDVRSNADNHWYECKVCGYKLMYDHNFTYSYNAGEAIHTVTCTDGDTVTGCGYSYTENHSGDWKVTKPATYKEEGLKERTCTLCGCVETAVIPMLEDTNAPVITTSGSTADNENFCGGVSVTVTDETSFTLTVTKDGEEYTVDDIASFTLTEAGTYVITATDSKGTVATKTVIVNAGHTVNTWTPVDATDHNGTCTVCGETVTASHTFTNPVLVRPTLVDDTWVDGTYTYTCVCGATKTEPAVRADYLELEEAVKALEDLKNDENLSEEAKEVIENALKDADDLADDLVTAEQDQIDALVKELEEIKADADEAIKNKELGVEKITEATSGVKVQFIDKSGLGTIENVQLGKDDGFKIRVANGNADSTITITEVKGPGVDATDDITLASGKSADFDVTIPDEAGIAEYTITYTIDGLMNADGTPVTATTKAYLYVKAEAYNPYHFMDEKTGIGGVSKWDHYVEATNYGDFTLISENTATKFSDKLESGTKWYSFGTAHTSYDYDEDGCQAGCTTSEYKAGDGHAATYGYFVDTSLAPTWQAAGFRLRIVETEESIYQNAPLKTIRVANDQTYLDGIKGDDKTFTLTFYPSATGTQNKTWAITSTGTLAVATYANPDEDNELLFGEHKNKDGFDENTVLALMTGEIPSGVNEAKFMLSPRIEFNGTIRSESVTMTSHIYLTSYDKAALREAVTSAETEGYNPGYFDEAKYVAYENALKTAKEVLGKAETNQAEIDEATANLNNAIAELTAAESEAKFVLTVTHSVHENADKNSEATSTLKDYYLVNGDVTPALKADVIAKDTINKYDAVVTLNVTADATHTYNYWYIDYSGVQSAIDAANAIINDTTSGYTEEYKQQAESAKETLKDILDGKDATTTPESQDVVDNAIGAVNALTGHVCDEAVKIPEVPATCKDTGLTEGAKCSVCGKITKVQTVTEKLPHNYDSVVTPPTCTDQGYTTYTCSVCGDSYVDNYVDAKDHAWTVSYEWASDKSTCTATRACGNDTSHNVSETVDATVTTTAATCVAAGTTTYTATFTAEWATEQSETVVGEFGDHAWGSDPVVTVSPSYDEETVTWSQGIYTYCCEVCDKSVEITVDRADYSKYDELVNTYESIANDEKLWSSLTEETVNALSNVKIALDEIPLDYTKETTDPETGITTPDGQAELNSALAGIIIDLENIQESIENGSGRVLDFTEFEAAVSEYEGDPDDGIDATEDIISVEEREKITDLINEIRDLYDLDPVPDAASEEQKQIDAATEEIRKIIDKYAYCLENGHTWGEWAENIVLDAEGNFESATYSRTCGKCGIVDTYDACREDYSKYDEAIFKAKELLTNEELTEAAKEAIRNALDEANKLDKNLPSDIVTTDDEGNEIKIDVNENAETIKGYTDALNDVINSLYDENGKLKDEYKKPNSAAAEEAVKEAEGLIDSVENLPETDKEAIEDLRDQFDEILNNIENDETPTAAEYQDDLDAIEKAAEEIVKKYADCSEGHTWVETGLARPTKNEDGTWNDGTYTYECENCGATKTEAAERANYEAYDEAKAALEALLGNDQLTEAAKDKITAALEANKIADNLVTAEQGIVDAAAAALNAVLTEINDGIADGSLVKPDYEAWEEAETAYDALDKTNVKSEIIAEADELKAEIAGKQADDTLTQATATQAQINEATARLNEIITGITDGSLKNPDYSAVEDKLDEVNGTDGLNKDTQDKIDAIEEALEEIKTKTEPEANAKDDQDDVDALEKELEKIITGIADGSALKPDYKAWEEAETAYDNLDKTNVKDEIVTEANNLKETIANKQANDTLTQATATQAQINEATARLNEIITGITDGSLKNPANFTEVNKDLAEAKDKSGKNDVVDSVKEDIKDIEDALNELKNDPTTNADDQDEIDALEKELEDIIAGITDGSLVKPDYSGADDVIGKAENDIDNGGKLSDEDKAALEELKKKLDEIKNDPTSNKKDDQGSVDEIKSQVQGIIDKYSDCANGNHSWKASKVVEPTCTAGGYTEYVCSVCGKAYRGDFKVALGHKEETIPAVDATCSAEGHTEGVICDRCGTWITEPQTIAKLPHTDEDEDGVCDVCGESDIYGGCVCLCHNKHWFWRLIYLIIRIIWRVFNIHQYCACGAVHYK